MYVSVDVLFSPLDLGYLLSFWSILNELVGQWRVILLGKNPRGRESTPVSSGTLLPSSSSSSSWLAILVLVDKDF